VEDDKYHSEFFAREERGLDLIHLENLYFLLVIFGGMGFLAVIVFTLTEMDWVILYYCCLFFAWKCLHAMRSVNYARFANRLCTFRLIRRTLRK
jgi:Ca2+/Na+ antiporter